MAINLTKSYLDLARMVHTSNDGKNDPQIIVRARGDEGEATDDHSIAAFEAMFSLVAAEYVFSHSALVAFTSSQLHYHWAKLQEEFPQYDTFDDLMKREVAPEI